MRDIRKMKKIEEIEILEIYVDRLPRGCDACPFMVRQVGECEITKKSCWHQVNREFVIYDYVPYFCILQVKGVDGAIDN